MRWAIVTVLMLFLVSGPSAAEELATARGVMGMGNPVGDPPWFALIQVNQRFELPKGPMPEAAWKALSRSNHTRTSIEVRYDLDSGRVTNSGVATFPVREIIADGRVIRLKFPLRTMVPVQAEGDALLARGVALHGQEAYAAAIAAMDRALANPDLSGSHKALAYKTRGRATTDLAYETPAGPELDRLLMAAKSDFEQWRRLQPLGGLAALSVGGALDGLGAYDQAMAIYVQTRREWPKDDFWTMIRIAGLHRKLGRHDEALKTLDDFAAARGGTVEGMPFHYHRAWALIGLGRNARRWLSSTKG